MTNSAARSDHVHDRPALSMDERVVWISDNGPEYGNIRWLGILPDLGKEWMAGVEFDNPVGSGTGLYKDRQLFVTPLNHASLVPVIGLIKASDFDEPSPQPPGRNSSVKLIEIVRETDHELRENRPNTNDLYINQRRITTHSSANDNVLAQSSKSAFSSRAQHLPDAFKPSSRIPHSATNSFQLPHGLKKNLPLIESSRIPANTLISGSKHSQDQLNDITSGFSKASLNDRGINYGKTILPPPALVVPPGDKNPASILKNLLGKSKGIQGHNNSCYLDATLFAMFSSTTLFDSLLYRPARHDDIPEYEEIQRILREYIVRPLREDYIVSDDQIMLFRTMLERSSTVAGLTDEEKDPEEFLSLLLGQILKAEPYLKLSSGLESFFYQLIVDKDESIVLPAVQDLFEQSFISSTVRLREIPPCLLLQMPRFGRQYKMYSRIMPSLRLDITDVLESAPRACGHRGKDCDNLAMYECKECFVDRSGHDNVRLSSMTYCGNCFKSKHFGKSHSTGIESHDKTKTKLDKTPPEAVARYSDRASHGKVKEIPRIFMDLFAVLCIETSHYVCFVKCGQDPEAPWCFFDSMADRRGEQNGYNIPEVLLFDEFSFWTSDKGRAHLLNNRDDKLLPEMARRLVCDAYLCFYQYTGLMTCR